MSDASGGGGGGNMGCGGNMGAQFGVVGSFDKRSPHAYSTYPKARQDRPFELLTDPDGNVTMIESAKYRHRKTRWLYDAKFRRVRD